MATNPPIIIDGTTPVISINTGDYDNGPIYVYLQSLSNLPNVRAGTTFTIRNNDGPIQGVPGSGVQPGQRRIYISTFNNGNPDYTTKFNDGTDTYLLGSNSGDSFSATIKNMNIWLKGAVVIQGQTKLLSEDITGYEIKVSSMTASSFSSIGSIYVKGDSIFRGPLIGFKIPSFITSVSTFLFSTGVLYTSSLEVLGGLNILSILASTVTSYSTINNERISTINNYSISTFTSSINLIDNIITNTQYRLIVSTNSLQLITSNGTKYTYQTLEQSGFSNISTQIAPTLDVSQSVLSLSSLTKIINNSLTGARFDAGVSSFSTSTRLNLDALGSNAGLSNLSNIFKIGISSVSYLPGLSSVRNVTLEGLSTVALGVPGGISLSTLISVSLSSLNVQPGLSSISSFIGPGLSSITSFVPISSLSTSIATSMSTVASKTGINNFNITIQSGISTLAVNPGLYNLSSIYSRGISSVAAGPGLSSLSSVIFSTASTFKSGSVISSLSTVASYGFSSLFQVNGYSSLVQTVNQGLSSIVDYGYIPYIIDNGRVTSTNMTSFGTSSLLRVIGISFSTISDGPGISSISTFFSKSLSGITVSLGLSSISTSVSRGLSSLLISMPFTSSYSTASTFVSSLYLRDLSSGQNTLIQLKGEDLFVSSLQYPQRLDYLNSSTFSTQVLEIKGSVTVSSLVVSSMVLTSSFNVNALNTKRTVTQSTSFSSITLVDYNDGFSHLFGSSNGILFIQNTDGYKSIVAPDIEGTRTMSTLFGFGYCNLTQYVNFSSVSSVTGPTLSTIRVDPGLAVLETSANVAIPPNRRNEISTLNVFTSTATFFSIRGVSFSTQYISTQTVSAQTLYVSSLITRNAQISTFMPQLNSVFQVGGSLITTSTFSTGNLFISSSVLSSFLQASSITIHNSNVIFSTVSAGRLYMSTLNFGQFSTLFASSGLLYIQTNCNVNNRNFVTIQPTVAVPNFFQPLFGISVPIIYASSIYTRSTMFVSTAQSSFTLDIMASLSSGIYSTNMQQLIVSQGGLSSFRVVTGYKNWDFAYLHGAGNTINSVTTYSPLTVFGKVGTVQDGLNNIQPVGYIAAIVNTFSTMSSYTYALEWDGRKILAGGVDRTLPINNYSNIQLYIAPSSWSNVGVFDRPSFFRYTPGCIYPNNNPFTICRDICYNGNQYVAVGDASNINGTIKYSYDGITWRDSSNGGFEWGTPGTPPTVNIVYYEGRGGYMVKWDGYKWVAGGSNNAASGIIKYSYDGITWTDSTYSGAASGGRLDRLVYYNNNIWVGTGNFTDCNIKYSYNGIVWSNAIYNPTVLGGGGVTTIAAGNGGTTSSNMSLVATQNCVSVSFANDLTANFFNTTCVRSFDGINYTEAIYGVNTNFIADQIYNGSYLIGNGNKNSNGTNIIANITSNYLRFGGRHILPQLLYSGLGEYGGGANINTGLMAYSGDTAYPNTNNFIYYGQRCKGVARSNVVPLLSMSNLKIFGSNYSDMSFSTNTIIGHKNLIDKSADSNGGTSIFNHTQNQNFMAFNNTLRIWTHTDTQVIVNTPNNPNTRYGRYSLARATLDVLCTINVRQATQFTRLKQVPAPFFTSSLGSSDQSFDFHVTGSTFMTNVGVGRGARSNDFFSTPKGFFDIYNNTQTSYVTFRGTVSNDTTVGNLLNATNNPYNVTCYPMVTGANSQLVYYWRNNSVNYRAVDATGTTYFTGQHPTNCLDISESNASDYVGQLVSITNDGYTIYDVSGNQVRGKDAIQITNASPITRLTSTDKDSSVFGVVADCFNNGLQSDGTIDRYSESQFANDLFGRIMVNCIGEGAIWVTNYGGNVSNGDYLCSCPIPGLSRKQDDGRLMNYTVAKATMSCDFNPPVISTISTFVVDCSTFSTTVSCLAYKCEEIVFNGSSFFKAFIGCTYHCN